MGEDGRNRYPIRRLNIDFGANDSLQLAKSPDFSAKVGRLTNGAETPINPVEGLKLDLPVLVLPLWQWLKHLSTQSRD